ncbi:four-helix bundle copper-binding protein [Sinomonas sp. JGH33]|uniref:Four-helix bundle copper-binding protein n=1 Tax=Sinomonas terricola TaxID=3110330 RepID=A0ABU5T152_9MICC|nr:four-helix bundle copper-binding protein [Sinomonas sp. JGH33]MEA5453221.1 four-helix bundle copper-binding protein [Sinomonas sp. JGH33]
MSTSRQALVVHPAAPDMGETERTALGDCIDAALACAQICTSGADSCLEEPAVAELRSVIRAQQNCASVCAAAVQILSRFGSDFGNTPGSILRILSEWCSLCRESCLEVAQFYPHCGISASACERVLDAVAALTALV